MAIIVINPYQYAAPSGPLADPYSDYASLLLHGNGTNNSTTFTDSSTNNHTVTANGDAKISTTQSKFGGASMYFDGSGDYLTVTDSSLAFGTGEFTVEFWMRAASTATNEALLSTGSVNTTDSWRISGGTYLAFYKQSGLVVGDTFPSLNTWHHVAIVRDASSVVTMYINGTNVDSATDTNNYSANNLKIGTNRAIDSFYDGYIDDLRITKGVARYTSNFTPPTTELPDPSDPDFSNVSLLLHGNGTDNSTTVTDSSSYDHTVTANGNARIRTTQSKFGGASMYFDGNGDYLALGNDASFAFGTGEFTVEFWVYILTASLNEGITVCGVSLTDGSWQIGFGSNGQINFKAGPTGTALSSSAVSKNTWHHLAVARDSLNTARIFLNGTIVDSATVSTDLSDPNLRIGRNRSGAFYFNGYIDDLRITKGVARYTANFIPPTEPFPND